MMKKACLLFLALLLCTGCTSPAVSSGPSPAASSSAELPSHLLQLQQSLNSNFAAQVGPASVVFTPAYEHDISIFFDSYSIDGLRPDGQAESDFAIALMDSLQQQAAPVVEFVEADDAGYTVISFTFWLVEEKQPVGQYTCNLTGLGAAHSMELYGQQYPLLPPPEGESVTYNTEDELPAGCNALNLLSVGYNGPEDTVYAIFQAIEVNSFWDEKTDEILLDITVLDEKVYCFPIEYYAGIIITELDIAGASGASHFTADMLHSYYERIVGQLDYFPPLACWFEFDAQGRIAMLTEA